MLFLTTSSQVQKDRTIFVSTTRMDAVYADYGCYLDLLFFFLDQRVVRKWDCRRMGFVRAHTLFVVLRKSRG